MRFQALLCVLALSAGHLFAAEPAPKDAVSAAAKKLGESSSYAWRQTTEARDDSQFRPGPQEGKIDKEGTLVLSMSFGDNTMEVVRKGDKGAATTQDGWQSFAEMESGEGFMPFFARRLRAAKAPAEQAAELVTYAKELKKDGEAYVSDLTDEGAKAAIVGFRKSDGGLTAKSATGSVKFWVKEGVLAQYEYQVKGETEWNGNANESDRTTTVEIKEVGAAKVTIPEAAKKKLM